MRGRECLPAHINANRPTNVWTFSCGIWGGEHKYRRDGSRRDYRAGKNDSNEKNCTHYTHKHTTKRRAQKRFNERDMLSPFLTMMMMMMRMVTVTKTRGYRTEWFATQSMALWPCGGAMVGGSHDHADGSWSPLVTNSTTLPPSFGTTIS